MGLPSRQRGDSGCACESHCLAPPSVTQGAQCCVTRVRPLRVSVRQDQLRSVCSMPGTARHGVRPQQVLGTLPSQPLVHCTRPGQAGSSLTENPGPGPPPPTPTAGKVPALTPCQASGGREEPSLGSHPVGRLPPTPEGVWLACGRCSLLVLSHLAASVWPVGRTLMACPSTCPLSCHIVNREALLPPGPSTRSCGREAGTPSGCCFVLGSRGRHLDMPP